METVLCKDFRPNDRSRSRDWCSNYRTIVILVQVEQNFQLLVKLTIREYEQEDVESVIAKADRVAHLNQCSSVVRINQRTIIN